MRCGCDGGGVKCGCDGGGVKCGCGVVGGEGGTCCTVPHVIIWLV